MPEEEEENTDDEGEDKYEEEENKDEREEEKVDEDEFQINEGERDNKKEIKDDTCEDQRGLKHKAAFFLFFIYFLGS